MGIFTDIKSKSDFISKYYDIIYDINDSKNIDVEIVFKSTDNKGFIKYSITSTRYPGSKGCDCFVTIKDKVNHINDTIKFIDEYKEDWFVRELYDYIKVSELNNTMHKTIVIPYNELIKTKIYSNILSSCIESSKVKPETLYLNVEQYNFIQNTKII